MAFDPKVFENDEDFKKYLESIIDAATKPLSDKRDELLGELKGLKEKMKKFPSEETLSELNAAKQKLEELENKQLEESNDYKKILEKARQQHTDELSKRDQKIGKLSESLKRKLVDGDLAKELSAVGVNPALSKAAIKLLSSDVTVIEENGEFIARVGEKEIADYVKEWAGTDVGKNFVLAKRNTGGNANGNGEYQHSDEVEKYFNPEHMEFNKTKQIDVYRKNKELYDQLTEKYSESK